MRRIMCLVYGEVIFSGAIYFIFHLSMLLDWISSKTKALDNIFVQQYKKWRKIQQKKNEYMHAHTNTNTNTCVCC